VSLNENRQPLSLTGPYGLLYLVAILIDLVLLGCIFSITSTLPYAPFLRPPEGRRLEPREVDKEEMVDGYPRFKRKV